MLATSRRGGRRPRKCVRVPEGDGPPAIGANGTGAFESVSGGGEGSSRPPTRTDRLKPGTPGSHPQDEPWSCSPEEEETPGRAASWPGSRSQPNSPGGRSLQSAGDIEGHITSSDLLNPSDALNLLAQVADLDGDGAERTRKPPGGIHADQDTDGDGKRPSSKTPAIFNYPPISDGVLSISMASRLLAT